MEQPKYTKESLNPITRSRIKSAAAVLAFVGATVGAVGFKADHPIGERAPIVAKSEGGHVGAHGEILSSKINGAIDGKADHIKSTDHYGLKPGVISDTSGDNLSADSRGGEAEQVYFIPDESRIKKAPDYQEPKS